MGRLLKNQLTVKDLYPHHDCCGKLPPLELVPRLLSVTDVEDIRLDDFVYFETTWGDYFHDAKIIDQMFSDWCVFNGVKESKHQKKNFFVQFFYSSDFYVPTVVIPA